MGISIWQLLIVALIVVLLFGTGKLKSIGGDLGSAIKGFKKSMKEDEPAQENEPEKLTQQNQQADADFAESEKESEKK